MPTLADVFIIETLDPDDEGNGRFEGGVISQMLRFHEKHPKYRYVRTTAQFSDAIDEFANSRYRYLHISAHANDSALFFTNNESIDFEEMRKIIGPCIEGRRVFFSACGIVNDKLADKLMRGTGCLSIIGPKKEIYFSSAAIVWASIYHLMFFEDPKAMKRTLLKNKLTKVMDLFGTPMGFYARDVNLKRGYTRDLFWKADRAEL